MPLRLQLAALPVCVCLLVVGPRLEADGDANPLGLSASCTSLDGTWLLDVDPRNVGEREGWETGPRPSAKPTKVPWIIQDAFPGYHGVAWYWRDFSAPANPHADGQTLLRFWAVDYKATVWVNGKKVGEHEGGEAPFEFDVRDALRPGATNRVAVRVLNPTHEPIDGIVLNETPHRNKVIPYSAGSSYNHGGITDSVELIQCASVRLLDIFARPNAKTGEVRVTARFSSTLAKPVKGVLKLSISPAPSGATIAARAIRVDVPSGDSEANAALSVPDFRTWELEDPNLYRLTARLREDGSPSFDERTVRFGFREFRFDRGYFRLNGRRLFLRGSHTGNHSPVGLEFPPDPDYLRRDLLNAKVMGFNMIRFIAGMGRRHQLDLADEIGLLVCQSNYAGWCLADSPQMASRFDASTSGMILRDRNHPSIVLWELLNETSDGAVFRHAVASLPLVRSLDDTRLVILNSGRFDGHSPPAHAGLRLWRKRGVDDPNVSFNPTPNPLSPVWATWEPDDLALHPGPAGQYSVLRWTAPATGVYSVKAEFRGIGSASTSDVHILAVGVLSQLDEVLSGPGGKARWENRPHISAGSSLDFIVGPGTGGYGGDTTALTLEIRAEDGTVDDPKAACRKGDMPGAPWSFGQMMPGPKPDASTFSPYDEYHSVGDSAAIGSLSNPGSQVWEDVLSDQHHYLPAPQGPGVLRTLRTLSAGQRPVFLSEFGVGSGVDLIRVARHYERFGKEGVEDARFYREKLDRFLSDWRTWDLQDCFARPEDFFAASVAKMARERLIGINAIRSNPRMVGHSLTGTVDQGMSGEGCWTTFRELKPGTADALFDAWAPLRWCLFAEPPNVYRGSELRLEAVLANEDVLRPGDYQARIQVVGPALERILETKVSFQVPESTPDREPPFALRVYSESLRVEGPTGEYQFLVTLERGGAAQGDKAVFFVSDPADMPAVEPRITLWGNDPELAAWLEAHSIRASRHEPGESGTREVILASGLPDLPQGPAAADAARVAYEDLKQQIEHGSVAIFLSPETFRKDGDPLGWLPLAPKGVVRSIGNSLYHKDEWAKRHPIFEGLPTGGLMDWLYYREIIPDLVWTGLDKPTEAVAGANNVAFDYGSGLMLSVHTLGSGKIVLNTLRIRENLGHHPAAERLLRNLLRWAAR